MTLTDAQIQSIGRLGDSVKANKMHYTEDSAAVSLSILYNQNNLQDESITIVTNTIYGYNKDGRTLTMITNYRVEPDGMLIDMDEYFTRDEQAAYIATLTKLEMNK